jgi:hypothetical protein
MADRAGIEGSRVFEVTNEYHPWRDGGPLAYGDTFRK